MINILKMDRRNKKKILIEFIIAIFILSLNFILAYKLGQESKVYYKPFFDFKDEFGEEYNKLFSVVWEKIKNNFVDQKKVDPKKAGFEAIRGIVRSLDDPYSDLYTPKQSKIFEEDLKGSFCGVGIEIGIRNNLLTVISPLEGTPAARAKIKAGDIISKINGEDTSNISLDEAVSKIRGECGTKVKLTIIREGWKEERDFEIVREEIKIKAVEGKLIEPDIGYIKINTFNINTVPEFVEKFNELSKSGAQKYILDLRNNPGGYLDVAIQLSEFFVPRGKIILKEIWGREMKEKVVRSEGPGTLKDLKTVILVNKGSASASEIFAGALRDNLGIKLIGEKTFGKGSVQEVYKLNSYLLKLTIAYWLTPNGEKLEGNGLEPDIKVVDKNPEDNIDEVLNKAIEILK
ncbi:MAG: S41 family peptidase [Minisyncoccia bacterium]